MKIARPGNRYEFGKLPFYLSPSLYFFFISLFLSLSLGQCCLPGKSFAFVYFNQHKAKAKKREKQQTEVWQIDRS